MSPWPVALEDVSFFWRLSFAFLLEISGCWGRRVGLTPGRAGG
ncbi:unnamed protein product [Ectocarpus sp. CCAP 1310/34]|nr:unnamed protein product [Ectocarpus sp. CCAP 1310/34]